MSGEIANEAVYEDRLEARALLRMLTYAAAEANSLGMTECAELIGMAADDVQRRIADTTPPRPSATLTRIH